MSDHYHRVYGRIWNEPWTETERYLAFYLLTCEHRTFEGIYRLPLAYACADLGWAQGKLRTALTRLEDCGFVRYDEPAGVVWICKALKSQRPNGNQARAAARKIRALPPSPLITAFRDACESLSPTLAEALAEAFGEPFPEPFDAPSGKGSKSLQASKHLSVQPSAGGSVSPVGLTLVGSGMSDVSVRRARPSTGDVGGEAA